MIPVVETERLRLRGWEERDFPPMQRSGLIQRIRLISVTR